MQTPPSSSPHAPAPAGTPASSPRSSDQADEAWTQALASWHRCRGRAERLDRNLLQYATAFAALMGITAGSGGILAIANNLQSPSSATTPEESVLSVFLLCLLGLGLGFSLVLGVLAIVTFFARDRADAETAERLNTLICHRPELFLPGGETSRQS